MASFIEEAMDNYMYSGYNPYSYRYINPKSKGMNWRQKNYMTNYGDSGEYFDNYQRAQLKAILSQVNPNLTPRLRKANTRDVGVQVNPRQDASVQCSLGPRPLLRRSATIRRPLESPEVSGDPASPTKTVRFPRTIAVYSPVAAGRLASFQEVVEESEKAEDGATKEEVPENETKEFTNVDVGTEGAKTESQVTTPTPGLTRLRFQASSCNFKALK